MPPEWVIVGIMTECGSVGLGLVTMKVFAVRTVCVEIRGLSRVRAKHKTVRVLGTEG